MKKMLVTNGEMITLTEETRNIGHGIEYKVIYNDGSEGWENVANILF